ncbi:uncharacterized protein LOC108249160 isoform X2 [Kryptolebias marmoratus]|nr:uncharacterized protein LOC108249160 isoform X2 [Kryptolebias marmoratus]XP_037832409.1 uncharacterized protein LOC108249160 isoform X2 [Kryptolebias marmoratus]
MRPDALQSGDLSLTLRTPTVSDSEVYTCTVRRSGQELSRISVPLKVTEPPPLWPKVVFPVLVVLSVLAAAVSVFFYCRYKTVKLNPAYKLHLVSVTEGQQYVLLPCKTKTRLPLDATVEWRRMDIDVVVHMYPNHRELPDEEDENYQNPPTKMAENPLRTRDLSLTLFNPRLADSGLYVCTVQQDGHKVKQKVVSLNVKGKDFEHIAAEVQTDGCLASDTFSGPDDSPGPDSHIWNWIRTENGRDRDSLRQSLKSSIAAGLHYQRSLASSCAFESSSGVYRSYRSVRVDDMTDCYFESRDQRAAHSDAGSQTGVWDQEPETPVRKTHVRQHSWV